MNAMNRDMIPAWVDGKLTPVEKMKVHREGLRHQAVSVFVMDRDKVLIQRRAMSKYHTPGLWANTCCTHPLWNEVPEACAIRRLREELGITGLYPSFRDQIEYRADVGGGLIEHEVVDVFLAQATQDLKLDLNPDEVMETRWISFYDLAAEVTRRPENFTAWLQIYLNEHTERIFGTLVQA
ncbi:isopentenyl-diphosphate delta-isomerase [Litoreibacter ponti]|uniref:Isopentenyl-diphosphate Delta-isomerase n=1 Tax=Litoreibacter ponti TaxID=1510457 RepID=A0A2T6BPG7_9RHOB|nr:isopentenyl-diphosphate Delta-isomerase [Litoreibacter ponti]PTX57969.1 isopentenyl-diphosphate delta-isomerase [Litoreibacter ponti]